LVAQSGKRVWILSPAPTCPRAKPSRGQTATIGSPPVWSRSRTRARRWAFAQTLAWDFEGDRVLPRHVEAARWLLPAT